MLSEESVEGVEEEMTEQNEAQQQKMIKVKSDLVLTQYSSDESSLASDDESGEQEQNSPKDIKIGNEDVQVVTNYHHPELPGEQKFEEPMETFGRQINTDLLYQNDEFTNQTRQHANTLVHKPQVSNSLEEQKHDSNRSNGRGTLTLNSLKNLLMPNAVRRESKRASKRDSEQEAREREEKIHPNSNSIQFILHLLMKFNQEAETQESNRSNQSTQSTNL